jgi:1,4-dihydroxy-6-naphthoate synthase
VRVVRRESECAVDARFELLRDDVLEPVRFFMDVVDVHAERLREIQLEQAVMADHLERDAFSRLGEVRTAIRLVRQQLERGEFLHHRRRRRGRDAEILRERSDRHAAVRRLELVDRFQVVLDRLAEHSRRVTWPVVSIRVGHSADPDDAFMVWALEAGAVDTRGLDLEPVVSDIQSLNEWALEGRLEVTALSAGAYLAVAERYLLLQHGASFGEGYGPIVVARGEVDLGAVEIVTPGPLTTAKRVLQLALGDAIRTRDLPFDQVLDEVVSGRAAAGLLIHEGQLTYADAGLTKLLDLGTWWDEHVGLPLPLGLVGIRRDVERRDDVSAVLREAIAAGLANRDQALAYAMRFGRGIDEETAGRFVSMYVNDLTLDMGERGRAAVTHLLGKEPEFAR